MGERGRKSAAMIEAERDASIVTKRPKPPASFKLNADEAEVWSSTMAVLPPNWIAPESYGIFASYCRAVVRLQWLSMWVAEANRSKNRQELQKALKQELLSVR